MGLCNNLWSENKLSNVRLALYFGVAKIGISEHCILAKFNVIYIDLKFVYSRVQSLFFLTFTVLQIVKWFVHFLANETTSEASIFNRAESPLEM